VYQESRFDPKAKSWVGAVGLMQLMPRTARSLGVEDPWDPSDNVRGGVKYLRHLYDRFDDRLHSFDRLAFALASYNVGYSHLRDARTLARMEKRNPDKWAGSVEIMLLRLSRRDYYSRVPAGYARGREGVGYVNSIVDRGHTYDRLLRHQRLSADRPVISARLSHEPVCTGR
jgi:membrane-bound lytic murein transglycosylase F